MSVVIVGDVFQHTIDSSTVNGNVTLLNAHKCRVFGNVDRVNGDNNTIFGHVRDVFGDNNTVYGELHSDHGSGNKRAVSRFGSTLRAQPADPPGTAILLKAEAEAKADVKDSARIVDLTSDDVSSPASVSSSSSSSSLSWQKDLEKIYQANLIARTKADLGDLWPSPAPATSKQALATARKRATSASAPPTKRRQQPEPEPAPLPKVPPAMDDEPLAANGEPCVVCLESAIKTVNVPCGHACLCVTCARHIADGAEFKCPMCNVEMERVMRMYLPSADSRGQ